MLPTDPLEKLSPCVYRSHARELLQRVEKDEDLHPGTAAEVLGVLVSTSTAAPLNATAFLLYCRLFREVMPEATEHHTTSPYEGEAFHEDQANDLLAEARRQLRSSRGYQ